MTHYPEGNCPACGHRMFHFPDGLEVNGRGDRVPWSCVNCEQLAALDWGREAFKSEPSGPEKPDQTGQKSRWPGVRGVRDVVAALSPLGRAGGDRNE